MLSDSGPEAEQAIKEACAKLPPIFRLRNHPGNFRASERASYVSRGMIVIYIQIQRSPGEECWDDFAKGTVSELGAQIC